MAMGVENLRWACLLFGNIPTIHLAPSLIPQSQRPGSVLIRKAVNDGLTAFQTQGIPTYSFALLARC